MLFQRVDYLRVQQVAHPTLIDTAENIGNTASAIANDPSIVPQAIGEAWDNKVEAYNNAQNDFERGFEIGTPFGELAPALTAAGSLGKAKTAEELATVGKTVGGYGDDLARGMGQYQRGSIGFADDAAGAGSSSHIWSKGPQPSSVDNAYGHWTKHGSDFPQYQNAKQYAQGANDFVKNPPTGTLTKTKNGDTMYYHPQTNTYAVTNSNGEVKTMFKPTRGKAYFDGK